MSEAKHLPKNPFDLLDNMSNYSTQDFCAILPYIGNVLSEELIEEFEIADDVYETKPDHIRAERDLYYVGEQFIPKFMLAALIIDGFRYSKEKRKWINNYSMVLPHEIFEEREKYLRYTVSYDNPLFHMIYNIFASSNSNAEIWTKCREKWYELKTANERL